MRSVVVMAASLLMGCAIAPPGVTGPYATHFSRSDVEQIATLVAARSDMKHDILALEATGPDTLFVSAGGIWSQHGAYTTFTAVRRHNRWSIDERSIQQTGWVTIGP
jgi:hypothetical protein